MALQEHSETVGADSTPPRNPATGWFFLGRVLYGWTDQRDPDVDRAWWRIERVRLYSPVAREPERARDERLPERVIPSGPWPRSAGRGASTA